MGLMMMESDPKRVILPNQGWFIEKKEDNRVKCAYIMPDFLGWGKVLFSFSGDFLGHW
jgi:hypothetical protein